MEQAYRMPEPWPTLDEQIAEIDREINLRGRVYPRWVSQKKLTRMNAQQQIGRLRAARASLLELKGLRGA